jgi:hypothetical protein
MNRFDAIKIAAEVVKAALSTEWNRYHVAGKELGKEVADAIEVIADRLVQLDSK